MSSSRKLGRSLSSSTGHASWREPVEELTAYAHERRNMSRSLLSNDDLELDLELATTATKSHFDGSIKNAGIKLLEEGKKKPSGNGVSRGSSFDTSMRNFRMRAKEEDESNANNTPRRRLSDAGLLNLGKQRIRRASKEAEEDDDAENPPQITTRGKKQEEDSSSKLSQGGSKSNQDLIDLASPPWEQNAIGKRVRRVSTEGDVKNLLQLLQKTTPSQLEGHAAAEPTGGMQPEAKDEFSIFSSPGTAKERGRSVSRRPGQDLMGVKLESENNRYTARVNNTRARWQRRNTMESSISNVQMKMLQQPTPPKAQQKQESDSINKRRHLPRCNSDPNCNNINKGSTQVAIAEELSRSFSERVTQTISNTTAACVAASAGEDEALLIFEDEPLQEHGTSTRSDKEDELTSLLATTTPTATAASTGVDDSDKGDDFKRNIRELKTANRRTKMEHGKEYNIGSSSKQFIDTSDENSKAHKKNRRQEKGEKKKQHRETIKRKVNEATTRQSEKEAAAASVADAGEDSVSSSKKSAKTKGSIIDATETEDVSTIGGSKRSEPQSVEEDEDTHNGQKKEGNFSSGFHVSPLMACILCVCYCLSLVSVGLLGYGIHLFFKEEEDASTLSNKDIGSLGNDDATIMIPSHQPTIYNDVESTATTSDGSVVSKTPPSSLLPSHSPSSQLSESSSILKIPPYQPILPLITSTIPNKTSRPSTPPSTTPNPSTEASSTPSSTPSASSMIHPSAAPSFMPSSSPTGSPGCPEQLLKSKTLDSTGLLLMKYEVVIYPDGNDLGGLLCVSLEYTGAAAGWIGFAFSEASRDPVFGRKEAIIGMPGIATTVAVNIEGDEGDSTLGHHFVPMEGGPAFTNPGKYEISAGGLLGKGYNGPSLTMLREMNKQTLVNGSVSIEDPYSSTSDGADATEERRTRMSFAKYLREPGEIEIDPFDKTLFLYAVATLYGSGEYYEGNPDWKVSSLIFLEGSDNASQSGVDRKRMRQHNMS